MFDQNQKIQAEGMEGNGREWSPKFSERKATGESMESPWRVQWVSMLHESDMTRLKIKFAAMCFHVSGEAKLWSDSNCRDDEGAILYVAIVAKIPNHRLIDCFQDAWNAPGSPFRGTEFVRA